MPDAIACRDLVAHVTSYLEEALGPARRRAVERHLAGCEDCRAYLEQMRRTIDALAALRLEGPAPGREALLLESFRTWARQRRG